MGCALLSSGCVVGESGADEEKESGVGGFCIYYARADARTGIFTLALFTRRGQPRLPSRQAPAFVHHTTAYHMHFVAMQDWRIN
ncbi:hypothetical protein CC80DRAFT_207314 [Byssothecium circinans]|uniref:Uncharacterized protein n=1 Tax=Byssothecium circinans TaxID=147558 RepID=A0A6A5TGI2_9PLEO|nr:hypothetical protein CC80DRAFT_207314 [Byssothecium circinans]